jgi:hypothetical protein
MNQIFVFHCRWSDIHHQLHLLPQYTIHCSHIIRFQKKMWKSKLPFSFISYINNCNLLNSLLPFIFSISNLFPDLDSSVGTATDYELNGPGTESW